MTKDEAAGMYERVIKLVQSVSEHSNSYVVTTSYDRAFPHVEMGGVVKVSVEGYCSDLKLLLDIVDLRYDAVLSAVEVMIAEWAASDKRLFSSVEEAMGMRGE